LLSFVKSRTLKISLNKCGSKGEIGPKVYGVYIWMTHTRRVPFIGKRDALAEESWFWEMMCSLSIEKHKVSIARTEEMQASGGWGN
jgi:hypothetical protein